MMIVYFQSGFAGPKNIKNYADYRDIYNKPGAKDDESFQNAIKEIEQSISDLKVF